MCRYFIYIVIITQFDRIHNATTRHVHRHFGGQVLKPKEKGTHCQKKNSDKVEA